MCSKWYRVPYGPWEYGAIWDTDNVRFSAVLVECHHEGNMLRQIPVMLLPRKVIWVHSIRKASDEKEENDMRHISLVYVARCHMTS
jgi:hypothetical protein